jgi:hypothetical protein
MTPRPLLLASIFAGFCLGFPDRASAHRLDEYLQAAKFSVERSSVTIEIDLTPGVSVAPRVLSLMDTDHDGRISSVEAGVYARSVLRSIELRIDSTPINLILDDQRFPEIDDVNDGVGVIRIRGSARLPATAAGRHELTYRNTHESDISVYLANALVPTDNQIEITAQRRDSSQSELAIDYRVNPALPPFSKWWLMFAAVAAGAVIITVRQVRK